MKIGTLTFHSAYNFGSNLQAYALQKYILKLSKEYNIHVDYSIINLRTMAQNDIYNYKNNNIIKKMIKRFLYGKILETRQKKFELFINEYLKLTKEYKTREDIISDNVNYDLCISGSDQVWNLDAYDFDWSYYLDEIPSKKKISYAVSSGPKKNNISNTDRRKISKLVNMYDKISVREEGTRNFIKQFTNKNVSINMDPTILLTKNEWDMIIDNRKIVNDQYILYYSLKPSKSRVSFLKKVSKKMGIKVVVAYPALKYEIMSGFIKKYDSGPLDFLNLVKNAKLIISSSFHGTIFSIIFNVPFYALNGKNDYRISTLLTVMKLEDRMIAETDNLDFICDNAFNVDFKNSNLIIRNEREKSKKYLLSALDIGDNHE
ncbi:MAG: polysaccharide pyruvyl transferase family protein [Bacilli bacterium]|nr:polysaccharide pyruvyl transferase family protein [Bacilli bacterium]